MQGDIVGIVDSAGAFVVEYKYDAWGKPIAGRSLTTAYEALGKLNPFRYRGYVWDEETELYYLRSRYYNPAKNRFVNSDAVVVTGILMLNAFAYCSNNPVTRKDPSGGSWNSFWNGVWDFICSIPEANRQAAEIDAQLTYNASQNISKAVESVAKSVSEAFAYAVNSAKNWWENKALPWIDQAKKDVSNALASVGRAIQDALHAQQQADILSAQMTYTAACKIGNWISERWQDIVNVSLGVVSIASGAAGILSAIGVFSIPVVGQVILGVISIGSGIWAIGDVLWW